MKLKLRLLLLGSSLPLLVSAQRERPNIVFLFADDMGYGDVSALNENSKLNTPNIDKIASEGVAFTDAHSCSSVSSPSRYGLLTGRYSWRSTLKSGVLDGYSESIIKHDRRTVANILHEEGYVTGCFGKWHLGWHWQRTSGERDSVDFTKKITDGPTDHGFDTFFGIPASLDMAPYVYINDNKVTGLPNRITQGTSLNEFGFWRKGPTGADFNHADVLQTVTNHAIDFIKDNYNRPFFVYLPFPAPHTPILPSNKYKGKSKLNDYGDFVLMVDDMVGQIERTLDSLNLTKNTILIFSTDNGCSPAAKVGQLEAKGHYPSYIYRGYKADLFEGGHRVPLLVQWQDKIKHHIVDTTVSLCDFYATVADIIGYHLQDNEAEDSYSLLPLFYQKGKYERDATVSQSIDGEFTIRQGNWKLLFSPTSGGWSSPKPDLADSIIEKLPKVQLYDISNDPGERTNLYKSNPQTIKSLTSLFKEYLKNGRSRKGSKQRNDPCGEWKQIKIFNND